MALERRAWSRRLGSPSRVLSGSMPSVLAASFSICSVSYSAATFPLCKCEDGVLPRACGSDWTADVLPISYWSAAMSQMAPPRRGSPSLSGLQRVAGLSHLSSEDRTAACGGPFPSRKPDPTWRLFGGAKTIGLLFSLCFQAKWASRSTLRLTAAPRRHRPPPCRGSAPTSTRRRYELAFIRHTAMVLTHQVAC